MNKEASNKKIVKLIDQLNDCKIEEEDTIVALYKLKEYSGIGGFMKGNDDELLSLGLFIVQSAILNCDDDEEEQELSKQYAINAIMNM